MKPPVFTGSKKNENLQNFIDDVQKIFRVMHATDTEAVELDAYQLKDVSNTWYETWEEYRGEDVAPATWKEFADAFLEHFIPIEVLEAKDLEFERLKQNDMSVNQYYLKFVSLAKYALEMVRDMRARVRRFVLELSDDLFANANIAAQNIDMTITKMVAFVQGNEDSLNHGGSQGGGNHQFFRKPKSGPAPSSASAPIQRSMFNKTNQNFIAIDSQSQASGGYRVLGYPICNTCGYYRHFVKGFSSISPHLTRLIQKKVKFQWSDACEKHFEELKKRLTSAPVLTLPEGTEGFVAYCDASGVGLGCVLMQHVHVDIFTYHKSLQYIFKQRELNLHQRRWLELLKDYDIDIFYHPGKVNVVADALSQRSIGSLAHVEANKRTMTKEVRQLASLGVRLLDSEDCGVVLQNRAESSLVAEMKENQLNDPYLLKLKDGIHKHKTTTFEQGGDDGSTKMYHYLKEIYWWNDMKQNVADFVAKCPNCQQKFIGEPSHVVPTEIIGVKDSLTCKEIPVAILDRQISKLRTKEIASVKVHWRNQKVEEATWEAKEYIKSRYPHLFKEQVENVEGNKPSHSDLILQSPCLSVFSQFSSHSV
ncbi:uncharacterized protein [Nicotiana tomentosiformis]|uniref:uncharacterized protein n=1 Tax=Nicotiana tomentosiformis TaxID=4098 RepID=UPI00388C88C1